MFEGLTAGELREQMEARGIERLPGESRQALVQRMADYDSTIAGARHVAMYGLLDGRRRA
ncbi:hypothetical protein AB0M02_00520 [Actinoplanes sp. NPDC051861]|uniref:hypothetical protein n=1 Tax=Actinoplanes sp. NPDC051861 TaxID=3155170 RepID=UPI003424AE05